jgi:hypothetical protein
MPHRLAPFPKGALTVGLKEPTPIALRTRPFLFAICLFGALHVPAAVPLAKRPCRPYRAALARGTRAPPRE